MPHLDPDNKNHPHRFTLWRSKLLFLGEFLGALTFVLVINLSLFAEHTGIIDVAVLLPTAEEWDNKSNHCELCVNLHLTDRRGKWPERVCMNSRSKHCSCYQKHKAQVYTTNIVNSSFMRSRKQKSNRMTPQALVSRE